MKKTFITMMLALMFGMAAQAQDTDSIYVRDFFQSTLNTLPLPTNTDSQQRLA